MGDRIFIEELECRGCGAVDHDVVYAPTWGQSFIVHTCRGCGHKTDLQEFTGEKAIDMATTVEGRMSVAADMSMLRKTGEVT